MVSLDVVGFPRLVQRNQRQTLRLVQRVYDRLIAGTIGKQGGKVSKTVGDGRVRQHRGGGAMDHRPAARAAPAPNLAAASDALAHFVGRRAGTSVWRSELKLV